MISPNFKFPQRSRFATLRGRQVSSFKTGFTIIELLVTMSIIVLVSSLILAKYPDFSEQIALERASRQVNLAIREAQVRAMAIKEFKKESELLGVFPAYGIYFNSAQNDEFILFADLNCNESSQENCKYDFGVDTIIGKNVDEDPEAETKIINGMVFNALCANNKKHGFIPSPSQLCWDFDFELDRIHVVILRPDPFIFLKVRSDVTEINGEKISDVEIIFKLPSGKIKTVGVWINGQVFIE